MEIEFRGIRKSNGNFIYGSLIYRPYGFAENEKEYAAIILFDKYSDSSYNAYLEEEVIPESVGQYTGLKDKNGVKIFHNDIIKVKSKHGFNSELMHEFKELKKLDSLNSIGLHFTGVVKLDLFRGLMFENTKNGYQEPIFTRHIDIKINHGEIEVIGNINQNKELLE